MNLTNKNLSSKTGALVLLNKKLKFKKYRIPKFIYFSKKNFLKNKDKIFQNIKKKFKKGIIIRSSSLSEDLENMSNAGKFKSFLNIKISKEVIFQKIHEVISDFKSDNDQIIVQEYEKKILYSGVIFTRDQNTNGPYYTINFDKSGRTDLITSGKYNPSSKTIIIYKNSKKIPLIFSNLIHVVKKIEKIFKTERLDIEFAIERKTNKVLIFQCRKLFSHKKYKNFDKEIDITINNIKKKLIKLKKQNPYLSGSTTIFSNMSDWNPAEMISSKPKNLSISLYSELITNEIWAKQRSNYGYSNVYPNNLMISLAGSPFIDLRTDLNSFMPQDLNKNIKNKIIDYSIKLLCKNPEHHDKIEFKIIPTCFDFNDDSNFKKILKKNEYSQYLKSLKKLTFNILNNYKKIFASEKNKLKLLSNQISKIKKSQLSHIQKIFYLVNDCKKNGTLPFAGVARCAFISTKILQSFVSKKIITENQYNIFFNQLNSITGQLSKDYEKYLEKKISKKSFINKYGHLRPQTYSINSLNYKSGFKEYFPKKINKKKIHKREIFKLNKPQLYKIKKIFKKHNISLSANDFFDFAKISINLREWAKFIFTKSINEIFDNLDLLSKEIKIPKSDFDYISINTILKYNSNLDQQRIKVLLKKEILENKKSMLILEQIRLPDFITHINNVDFFFLDNVKGNFITNKSTFGKIKNYKKIKSLNEVKDSIVLIDNADPGYDFLFSYNIKGLITKYGGANSHMAIRCMELQLPAIIGIGEKNFDRLKDKNSMLIDSDQKIFRILN